MRRAFGYRRRRNGSVVLVAAVCGVLAITATVCVLVYVANSTASTKIQPILHTAATALFEHTVVEEGELESSSRVEVQCEVRSKNQGGTSILWVIDEGTQVEEGDLLCTLDSSALNDELTRQRIAVSASKAAKIQAESALEQAEIAKEEYLKGIFRQEEQLLESDILIATERVSRAEDTARYSRRLAAQGFLTDQQLQADIFAVKQAKVDLELAEAKLKTLRDITQKKMLVGFNADIEASAAQLESQSSSFFEEESQLTVIQSQIEKCKIVAPRAGQVVHANQRSNRGGGGEFVVEAGAAIRERQAIVYLPDPKQMQVKATINESRVPYVREEMPVRIRIGAFEQGVLEGRVKKVNKYAEPTSWMSQVKEYATFVEVLNPPESIRTGMTAQIEIFVQKLKDKLVIPVQTVYETKGHVFVMVQNGKQWDTREIKVGPSNEKFIVVESGLEPGEQIVMNPRKYEELMEIPEGLKDEGPEIDESKMKEAPVVDRSKFTKKGESPGRGGPGADAGRRGGGGKSGERGRGGSGRGNMMTQFDSDGDGKISKEEMEAIDPQRRGFLQRADANRDGEVTTQEVETMIKSFQRGRQGGGGRGAGG